MLFSLPQLLEKSIKLCNRLGIMPFENGSMIVLAHIEHDSQMHDLNVCFHELGHLYSLSEKDFGLVLDQRSVPHDCANNIGTFIEYNMTRSQRIDNELRARAVQIGLNIAYNLWPGYKELSGSCSEYSEWNVRRMIAEPQTADSVIRIMHDFNLE